MKRREIVLFLFVCVVLVGLSGFSVFRNKSRTLQDVTIAFSDPNPVYLSDSIVNKLLIQNKEGQKDQLKDSLDLDMLETLIEKIPAVATTEAYVYPDGRLGLWIEERRPFLKVESTENYFLDRQGNAFELPQKIAVTVPIVSGDITSSTHTELIELVTVLQEDDYLGVQEFHIDKKENTYELTFSGLDYAVAMGPARRLKTKINKLKAYRAYQLSHPTEGQPSRVNLAFEGQVVVTKE